MYFDRSKDNQIVLYYEKFLMNHTWASGGIPQGIGDWYLLVGMGEGLVEYPLRLKAIYVDDIGGNQFNYIYVETTEDMIMKMLVSKDLNEILKHVPFTELKAVNALLGGSVMVERDAA